MIVLSHHKSKLLQRETRLLADFNLTLATIYKGKDENIFDKEKCI